MRLASSTSPDSYRQLKTGPMMLRRMGAGIIVSVLVSISVMSSTAQAALCDGLVGHWSLDGNATDSSGNGNNGSVQGGATVAADRTGTPGRAYDFDGVDDYIDIGNNSILRPPLPISVAAWIRPDGLAKSIEIFTNDYTANYTGIWLQITAPSIAPSVVAAWICDGGFPSSASRRGKYGSTTLTVGTWYHVVGVIRGPDDVDLYLNGVNDGGTYDGSGGGLAYSGSSGSIGRKAAGSVVYADGAIDDVYMFSRALTAAEVQALYNGDTCASEPPPSCSDSDGDGEADPTDRCPGTPPGGEVNDSGCTLDQYCAKIDATTRSGKRACKLSVWKNDPPRTNAHRDCTVTKGGRGPADDHCISAR